MATRASSSLLSHLKGLVTDIVDRLPGVETKRMFGSDAWLIRGSLFVIVMGNGDIVVRLPDSHEALLAIDGATPWQYGTKAPMRGWVVVPPDFLDDTDALTTWILRAFAEAPAMSVSAAKAAKKTAAKKTTSKKTASKKTASKKTASKKTASKKAATKKTRTTSRARGPASPPGPLSLKGEGEPEEKRKRTKATATKKTR